MSVRDRAWAPVQAIRAVGPLAGLSTETVRAALVGLHAADPTARLLSRLDNPGWRWAAPPAPEFTARLDSLLLDVDRAEPATVDSVVRRLLPVVPGDRAMVLAVHGNYLAARISHGVGDGRVVNRLLLDLLLTATQPQPAAPRTPGTRAALARAVAWHFRRHPAALAAAARVALPPPAPVGTAISWASRLAYSSARSPADGLRRLREWRDAHLPGVTTASIVFAAASSALRQAGLCPYRAGVVILIDARRYLPPGSTVDGNFSWGQYLVPTDPEDPRAIDTVLKAELASGRALLMLALRDARAAVLPRSAAAPSTVGPVPGPDLSLSHLGRLDGYAELPWTGAHEGHRFVCVPPPAGPAGITFSLSEMSGALHVTAAFHGSTFPQAAVDRAVELVATRPVDLVMAAPRPGLPRSS
jgi:hypothetical protein